MKEFLVLLLSIVSLELCPAKVEAAGESRHTPQPAQAASSSARATGIVCFPPGALDRIRRNAQRSPLINQWLSEQLAAARANQHSAPHTRKHLDTMDKPRAAESRLLTQEMDLLLAFSLDYALNHTQISLAQAERYLTAWASTYEPMGHPMVDGPFAEYVIAYELVRDAVSPHTRQAADAFLLALYNAQVQNLHKSSFNIMAFANKWSTHCLNVTAIAFLRQDPEQIAYAQSCYVNQLSFNIYPQGTPRQLFPFLPKTFLPVADTVYPKGVTFDFIHRDALLYHLLSIGSLLAAATMAENNGLHWFTIQGERGQQLAWAFDFVVPYATGQQRHYEFGQTLITNDRGRQRWFDPEDAVRALTLAVILDANYRAYADLRTLNRSVQWLMYATYPLD